MFSDADILLLNDEYLIFRPHYCGASSAAALVVKCAFVLTPSLKLIAYKLTLRVAIARGTAAACVREDSKNLLNPTQILGAFENAHPVYLSMSVCPIASVQHRRFESASV